MRQPVRCVFPLVVDAKSQAGLDVKPFRSLWRLARFQDQAAGEPSRSLLALQRSFFDDVSGNDNFRAIGELKQTSIIGPIRRGYLYSECSQKKKRRRAQPKGRAPTSSRQVRPRYRKDREPSYPPQ